MTKKILKWTIAIFIGLLLTTTLHASVPRLASCQPVSIEWTIQEYEALSQEEFSVQFNDLLVSYADKNPACLKLKYRVEVKRKEKLVILSMVCDEGSGK
jgi:hypothetical protein